MIPSERALLVDDDSSWREILSELLEDCGLVVDAAESYEQARPLIKSHSHRVAVVDLSLDESDHRNQDGLRVLELVQSSDPYCQSILLTGYATVELAVSVLTEKKAVTCLQKERFSRADFRLLLQKTNRSAPRSEVGPVPSQVKSRGRALVVDDDAGWSELLSEILEEVGLTSTLSPSFAEARSLLEREKFELAVIDLQLASSVNPDNQDGLALLRVTRKACVPAIVVSGTSPTSVVERTFAEENILAFFEKQKFSRAHFSRCAEQCLTPSALEELTEREREVLDLLAEGFTNQGIAERLFISTNTVKRHLKSVFEKLNVSNRAAAAALVTRDGNLTSH